MMNPILHPLAAALLAAWALPAGALAQDDEPKKEQAPEPEHNDYRLFTAKNGKTIEARVVARIDDERYTVETREGQSFTLNIETLSASDQQFLEFWEPGAIIDFATASLSQVLEKMNYSAADLTTAGALQLVTATVDGKDLMFALVSNQNFSALDVSTASDLGLELSEGKLNFRDDKGNTERTKQGTVDSFRIGDVELDSVEFQVFDIAKLAGNLPASTAGVLGNDLLLKLNALVDLSGQRLFVKKDE